MNPDPSESMRDYNMTLRNRIESLRFFYRYVLHFPDYPYFANTWHMHEAKRYSPAQSGAHSQNKELLQEDFASFQDAPFHPGLKQIGIFVHFLFIIFHFF